MDRQQQAGFSLLELILVAALSIVVAAIAIPMSGNALGFFRLSGDARSVTNAMSLTKMRAASDFTQARLYIDRSTKTYHLETYNKTAGSEGWVWQTGSTQLSQNTAFSFGSLAAPPSGTQAAISQAPDCLNNAGNAIANTSCVVFNSRGIPITCTTIATTSGCQPAAPTTNDALYITDGTAVYGMTVIATGMIQVWRSAPNTANWTKQ
jgi:Tfp pilus assembly protein FimT